MLRGRLWAGACWLMHALGYRNNSLRRGIDRGVAVLTVLLLAGALFAVPVAATWGSMSYERELVAAEQAAATRHRVEAVVTGPLEQRVIGSDPHGAQTTQSWAPVSWTGLDGRPRTEPVRVDSNAEIGAKVPVWVDTTDRITFPPPSADAVLASAIVNGVAAFAAMVALCVSLIALVHALAGAVAGRDWGREWEQVEPRWTQRQQ